MLCGIILPYYYQMMEGQNIYTDLSWKNKFILPESIHCDITDVY